MEEDAKHAQIDTVGAVETMFDILEHVYDNEGIRISELAEELGYSKSTIHRHLSTLLKRGYIVEDDGYHVGLRFLKHGEQARTRYPSYKLARKKVEELAEETSERAQFIVEEHGDAVYIDSALGEHGVTTVTSIGSRIPLQSTAAGKAILAALPEDKLSRIIEQIEFKKYTEHSINSEDELLTTLDQVRERGYAFNKQENINGLHAVGTSVRDPEGYPIGALSISGPAHRLTGDYFEEELPTLLLGAANELELNIEHLSVP